MLTVTSVAILLVSVVVCHGFQIDSERQKIYKNVVERTLKKERPPPLVIADDCTYSPFISCPSLKGGEPCDPVARPLSDVFSSCDLPPARNAKRRKLFGIDEDPAEYWFDNRIHTFGNTGLFGGLHAACAPLATRIIDDAAYRGFDVRTLVSEELRKYIGKSEARVLDMCCGVGMSTRALQAAFHDAEAVVGLDTSPQMLGMAKFITNHENQMKNLLRSFSGVGRKMLSHFKKPVIGQEPSYALGNAERTIFKPKSFDLVTIMYALHEIPHVARYRILREVRRVLMNGGTLAIIDIAPEYTPSATMLAGEPYVLEYKENIHKQLKSIRGFANFQHFVVVPGHVNMWLLTRADK